jgi:hypothetical protein
VGLGFLFLLAGYELDLQLLREQVGKTGYRGLGAERHHRGRGRSASCFLSWRSRFS